MNYKFFGWCFALLTALLYTFYSLPVSSNNGDSLTSLAKEELRILTWNVYLRPRLLFNNGQLQRAQAIVNQLKDKAYDVIVFQEAIDNKARKLIWEGLKDSFPYQSNRHKGAFMKTNSGVWILSKHPIQKQKNIIFRSCVGSDCFCRKGATLIEITKNNKNYQVIGTHLQSEVANQSHKQTRREQYFEINEYLMKPNEVKGVPQLVVGDLNTPEQVKGEYVSMLNSLETVDGEKQIEDWSDQASWGAYTNDLFNECEERKAEVLDYILLKHNGRIATQFKKSLKKFRSFWNGKNQDLSDHYAVEAHLIWH